MQWQKFSLIWSKLYSIQTCVKAFFVRNPAALMNRKTVFIQATTITTLMPVELTFETSITFQKANFGSALKIKCDLWSKRCFQSAFQGVFCHFSCSTGPEISLCDSRKVFALELSKQQSIFNYSFIKLQIRPRGNYTGISFVLEGIKKRLPQNWASLVASLSHQEGSHFTSTLRKHRPSNFTHSRWSPK